ncbi:hypothetical protein Gotur_012473 [Gossypium turneri]
MGKASSDRHLFLFVWMKNHFRCLYKRFL